jgi:monoamine oxidase
MDHSADVLIIGAGAAGLSAARELSAAGTRVLLLEGRDRVGGRIFTHHTADYPVELGAEFVHGRPPETLELVRRAGPKLAELEWRLVRRKTGHWVEAGEIMAGTDRLFARMSTNQPDQSFQQFVDQVEAPPDIKEQALRFVEGFHAADPRRVSVHSLVKSNAAEQEIDGDRQFRFPDGYETLVKALADRINWKSSELQLSTTVTEIEWKPGESLVRTASGAEFRAPRLLITVPLGVLKTGSIRFHPILAEKEQALQALEMGPVIRASLCFRNKFWEAQPRFKDLRFMFTEDPHFPTWWTSHPLPFPILTGWTAGRYARALEKLSAEQVIQRAAESLASIFEMPSARLQSELQAGFTHNWQSDPFSCGAYSYALVSGSYAGRELGASISDTLFFAGEATDADGHNGTVHGAIASGLRAAKEILTAAKRR